LSFVGGFAGPEKADSHPSVNAASQIALSGGSRFSGEDSRGRPRTKGARDDRLGPQCAQGGVAMVAEQFDQFVDQLGLVGTLGAHVAPAHLGEDFLTSVLAPLGVPGSVTPIFESSGVVQQPRPHASVSVFLSQIATGSRACRF